MSHSTLANESGSHLSDESLPQFLAELVADRVASRLHARLKRIEEFIETSPPLPKIARTDTDVDDMLVRQEELLSRANAMVASLEESQNEPLEDEVEATVDIESNEGREGMFSPRTKAFTEHALARTQSLHEGRINDAIVESQQRDFEQSYWDDSNRGHQKGQTNCGTPMMQGDIVIEVMKSVASWLDIGDEPKRTGYLAELVQSKKLDRVCLSVIALDTVLSIITSNYCASHVTFELPKYVGFFNIGFCVVYFIELVLKLFVHRLWFFFNGDRAWNVMDMTIVTLSTIEVLLQSSVDISFVRMCRILRVGRSMRNLKAFRFLSSFRLIVVSIVASMWPFLWTVALLCFILMQFSMLFMFGFLNLLVDRGGEATDEYRMEAARSFGSVGQSMLSLLECVTGGRDWGPVLELINECGVFYAGAFLTFVFFFIISFLNISTSLFVEKALRLAKPDTETIMLERRNTENKAAKELRALIDTLDGDQSGEVTLSEWKKMTNNPEILVFFELCDLDIKDVDAFFRALLEVSGKSTLDVESFVQGCMKMKGMASSIDVQILLTEVKELHAKVRQISCGLRQEHCEITPSATVYRG